MKQLLYIDLFCGAGGTSTGVNAARLHNEQCAEVIACVNHDAKAIASHAANHPNALHFTEDIRTLELSPLVAHLQKCKAQNPGALVVLWASLECTNFSKAKGGQPDSKNISVEEPAGTITTIDHHAFVSVHYGHGFNISCARPAATLTTKDKMSLVQVKYQETQAACADDTTNRKDIQSKLLILELKNDYTNQQCQMYAPRNRWRHRGSGHNPRHGNTYARTSGLNSKELIHFTSETMSDTKNKNILL